MRIARRSAGPRRLWYATAAALLLCAAAGIALDLYFYVASGDHVPAQARSSIPLVGAPVLHASARVRPLAWQLVTQPAIPSRIQQVASAPRTEGARPAPCAAGTNRERLADLTVLRI